MATGRSAAAPDGLLPHWYLRHGLRTTMVPDTLLRLAATATCGETLEAANEAFVHRKTATPQLVSFLAARGSRRGAGVLRDIVEGPRTRSHLERPFLELLRGSGAAAAAHQGHGRRPSPG